MPLERCFYVVPPLGALGSKEQIDTLYFQGS